MVNCPCKSRSCVCKLEGDLGLRVSGNGSGRQPYIPSWALFDLVPGESSQTEVTITGSGTTGDPWVVTVDTLGGTVVRSIYTADDTWVKPSGTMAEVVVIGGGGGGGATASLTAAVGGSGGSGGAMSVGFFAVADLPSTVDVKVGSGGLAGRPISGLTTGEDGGESWFGECLYAAGGRGGKAQASPSQTAHPTAGGTAPDGGPGGAGAVRDSFALVPAESHYNVYSPTGGGIGNGLVIHDSAGGVIYAAFRTLAGQGGSGGGLFAAGRGGLYGGGGGGGGINALADDLRPGGDGADGVVVVTVW